MGLLEIMLKRRSIRKYTDEPITEENLKLIIQAGLLSASGKAKRPWRFIVVRDKELLKKMSDSRIGAAKMLENAGAAIAVVGDEETSDTWIEDCSIAMSNMHLMADSLGVGSCWIQGRLREQSEGISTEEYIRNLLDIPDGFRLEAMLSLGMPEKQPKPHSLDELATEKVYRDKFGNQYF